MIWWNNAQKEKGAALYIAILTMVLVLGIVFGVGTIFLGQIKTLQGVGHSVVALYAAEAGFENILYQDFQGNTITDCDGSGTAPAFCDRNFVSTGASYKLDVQASGVGGCGGQLYCVESTGTC